MNKEDGNNLTPEDVKELLEVRHRFFKIAGDISRIIEPRIFELLRDNINSLRNTAIISGALATFGLLLLDNSIVVSDINFLKISILGFLLTIVFSSFHSNKTIIDGINSYSAKLEENLATAEKVPQIINECLDRGISKKEADKKLILVYREIEYERIRIPSEEKANKKIYIYDLVNYLFVLSILVMILYLVF